MPSYFIKNVSCYKTLLINIDNGTLNRDDIIGQMTNEPHEITSRMVFTYDGKLITNERVKIEANSTIIARMTSPQKILSEADSALINTLVCLLRIQKSKTWISIGSYNYDTDIKRVMQQQFPFDDDFTDNHVSSCTAECNIRIPTSQNMNVYYNPLINEHIWVTIILVDCEFKNPKTPQCLQIFETDGYEQLRQQHGSTKHFVNRKNKTHILVYPENVFSNEYCCDNTKTFLGCPFDYLRQIALINDSSLIIGNFYPRTQGQAHLAQIYFKYKK